MNEILRHALDLHCKGLRLVPLQGKAAILRNWPDSHLTERDIRSWSACGVNWGIITGEPLIVLDTDTDEAEAWVRLQKIESPVMVQTGRGGLHRYFLASQDAEIHSTSGLHKIHGLDVKAWRSYVVAAGSTHPQTDKQYRYLPGKHLHDLYELPIFRAHWLASEKPRQPYLKPLSSERRTSGRINDVRAYIRSIASIEGEGGDRACFVVACVLVEAGFSFEGALAEMEVWNAVAAFPMWSREELARKLHYAFKRITGA